MYAVIQVADKLGMKLLLLSQRVEQNFELKHLIRPYLVRLRELTGETVHLAILDKGRVLYVDTVESIHSIRLVAKIGSTNSIHCTSLGKALVSGHDRESIYRFLVEQGMERRTDHTLVDPSRSCRKYSWCNKRVTVWITVKVISNVSAWEHRLSIITGK